jgi:hypothetical protein
VLRGLVCASVVLAVSTSVVLAVSTSVVLAVSTSGCSASDHPAPAGDSTIQADTSALAPGSAPCEPRSARACRHHYRDERGQPQCPMSFQLCRADGAVWLPCAMYIIGPDGDPVLMKP